MAVERAPTDQNGHTDTMSDVGEHIVTEPEEDEVASAALQRSRFGITGEVIAPKRLDDGVESDPAVIAAMGFIAPRTMVVVPTRYGPTACTTSATSWARSRGSWC